MAPKDDDTKPTRGTSDAPAPSTQGRRASGMSPSGDALVRDALVALHNLVTLLEHPLGPRPPSDPGTLDALRPEVDLAVAALRHAFVTAPTVLAEWTLARLVDLDLALAKLDARGAVPELSAIVADVAAAGELLDVVDRARHREPIEVPLEALARAAHQAPAVFWAGPARLWADPSMRDVVVRCDPHLGTRLVALAIALVHGEDVAMSARTDGGVLFVRVAPGTTSGQLCTTRRLRRIAPMAAVASVVAESMGVGLLFEDGAVEVALRPVG